MTLTMYFSFSFLTNQTQLTPTPGADRRLDIQNAIDNVGLLPIDPTTGFRGAVLLKAGEYLVSDPGLKVYESGIVIRGEGQGAVGGTTIVFTSTIKTSDAITLGFTNGQTVNVEPGGVTYSVTDSFVPVGSMTISITDASLLSPGDQILIQLMPNNDWLLHSTYCKR